MARTLDLAAEFERERERRGGETRIEASRNVLAALCESVIGAAFEHFGYRETADAVVEAFQRAHRISASRASSITRRNCRNAWHVRGRP